MRLFDLIKFNKGYICIEEIPKGEYCAFGLDCDEAVTESLNSIGIKCAVAYPQDFDGLSEQLYNPLLRKQNIFLTDNNGYYEIPYLLIKHRNNLEIIEQVMLGLKNETLKKVYIFLMKYILTKNLRYLNPLVKLNAKLDPAVFSVLGKAISDDSFNQKYLEEAIAVLNGRELEKTPVYNRYTGQRANFYAQNGEIYKKIEASGKKKNIVFIHLESLSDEIYNNHPHNFPALSELASKSLRLNYYSSASSSCMSLIDLFFGNDFESDSFPLFDEMYLDNNMCKNMFQIYQENGYYVAGIGYKELKTEEINHFNLWQVDGQKYEWKDSFGEFTGAIGEVLTNSDKPFALHIWNLMPHIGHNDEDTYKGNSYIERMDLSYTSLDMTVEFVLEYLNKRGILDDTVIICYGDHGDDKWTRSMNYGCTHIIPPHRNVIKCPAFIYDSRISPGILTDLVSTVDLKGTSFFLAGIDDPEVFFHRGINIFESKNEFVYSRSHLTNQRCYQKINSEWVARLNNFCENEHKNKSFGIVNHSYNMVVGKDGLEFFMHKNDPGSYNNLLDFFELDSAGNITRFNNRGAWRGHFRSIMMADDQIYDIIKNYYILRDALIARIELKNSMINCDELNLLDMSRFNIARKRGFLWD